MSRFNLPSQRGWSMRAAMLVWTGVTLAAALGCGQHATSVTDKRAATTTAPKAVPVTKVALHRWPTTVRVQGSILGDEESVLSTKVAGRIFKVCVDLGSRVKKGDALVELDPRDFRLRVDQAKAMLAQARAALGLYPDDPDSKLDPLKSPPVVLEAALVKEAKSNLERANVLFQRNAFSGEELEQRKALLSVAEARFQSALNAVREKITNLGVLRAQLELAEEALKESQLVAPFDGIVEARRVAEGEYVQVGQAAIRLVRIDPLRFRATVPERQAGDVKAGQDLTIRIEGRAEPLLAKITRVSPALDLASRSLLIESDLPNPDLELRSGLFAEGEIIVDTESQTLAIPQSAIEEFAGVEKVWLVTDGAAKEKRIFTGRRDGYLVEVLQGLNVDDRVIQQSDLGYAGKVIEQPAQVLAGGDRDEEPVAETGG